MTENHLSSAVDIGLLGAISALGLWFLSRTFEICHGLLNRRRGRSSVLRSLFAEVDYNTRDMEIFLEQSPQIEDIEVKLHDSNFVPHITDARQTAIFHANLHLLHHMQDELIQDLVAFYGDLEKLRARIDGITKPSYKSISVEGQINVIRRIYDKCEECQKNGQRILCMMMKAHPNLKLERSNQRQMP